MHTDSHCVKGSHAVVFSSDCGTCLAVITLHAFLQMCLEGSRIAGLQRDVARNRCVACGGKRWYGLPQWQQTPKSNELQGASLPQPTKLRDNATFVIGDSMWHTHHRQRVVRHEGEAEVKEGQALRACGQGIERVPAVFVPHHLAANPKSNHEQLLVPTTPNQLPTHDTLLAYQSCTPRMRTTHAHHACTPLTHTTHAHHSRTPRMHTTHAHHTSAAIPVSQTLPRTGH